MIRSSVTLRVLLVISLVVALAASSASAQSALFDVRTRPVTDLEIGGGAPTGTVFEFYTTTETDFLSLSLFDLSPNFYQHQQGADSAPSPAPLHEHFPAISADSWFNAPGNTVMLGDGFQLQSGSGRESLWGDLDRTGGVTDFQFGSLTVPHGTSANFRGDFRVANPAATFDTYSLDFTVDSAGTFGFHSSDAVPFRPPTPTPKLPPPPINPVEPVTPTEPVSPTTPVIPYEPARFEIRSRSVTDLEIAAGAPAGTVFDLFATTQTDFLSFGVTDLSHNFYQHEHGADSQAAPVELTELYPGLAVDSWFTAPGSTVMLGEGFQLSEGKETLWGDLQKTGAMDDFHFGRLTVPDGSDANFSGEFVVANEASTLERYLLDFSVSSVGDLIFDVDEPFFGVGPRRPQQTETVPPTAPSTPSEPTPDRSSPPNDDSLVETAPEIVEPPMIEEIVEAIEVVTPVDPVVVPTLPPVTTFPGLESIDLPELVFEPTIIDYRLLVEGSDIVPTIVDATSIDRDMIIEFTANDALALSDVRLRTADVVAFDGGGADLVLLNNSSLSAALEAVVPEPQAVALTLLGVLGLASGRVR